VERISGSEGEIGAAAVDTVHPVALIVSVVVALHRNPTHPHWRYNIFEPWVDYEAALWSFSDGILRGKRASRREKTSSPCGTP